MILGFIMSVGYTQNPEDIFNIYFLLDFEDNTIGLYDHDEWAEDWNYPWDLAYKESDTTMRVVVNNDPEQGSKVLRFVP